MNLAVDPRGADGGASQAALQGLPDAAKRIWRIESGLGALLASVLALVILDGPWSSPSWVRWLWPALAVIVGWSVLDVLWLVPRRHRLYRYGTSCGCMRVVQGRVLHSEMSLPMRHILYSKLIEGPLLRSQGLAKVELGTIAGSHSIGPMTFPQAEKLVASVIASVGEDHEANA